MAGRGGGCRQQVVREEAGRLKPSPEKPGWGLKGQDTPRGPQPQGLFLS